MIKVQSVVTLETAAGRSPELRQETLRNAARFGSSGSMMPVARASSFIALVIRLTGADLVSDMARALLDPRLRGPRK